jgi:hypothetical protein
MLNILIFSKKKENELDAVFPNVRSVQNMENISPEFLSDLRLESFPK